VTQDRSVLVDAIQGRENMAISLWLGQLWISGDSERAISFQRLFGNRPEMATAQTGHR
jgi:hypothetical protein